MHYPKLTNDSLSISLSENGSLGTDVNAVVDEFFPCPSPLLFSDDRTELIHLYLVVLGSSENVKKWPRILFVQRPRSVSDRSSPMNLRKSPETIAPTTVESTPPGSV